MHRRLEDILIQMDNDLMTIEDEAQDELSRLEAKKLYILGVFTQLDTELSMLEREYENAAASYFGEEEQLELFEKANESYKELMGELFKVH